jgi:hypothetical protein
VRKYQLIKVDLKIDLKDGLMEIKESIINFVSNPYVLLVGFIASVLTIWSFFKKNNNGNNNGHQQNIKGNNNQQAGRDIVNNKDKP